MPRKCKECKAPIPSVRTCDTFFLKKGYCSIDHMASHGMQKARDAQAKKERKEHKARKEALKSRGDHAKDAQAEVNKFIRTRDKGKPCISCGNMPNSGAYVGGGGIHAGHYRSVGACPELRYCEDNIHIQCVNCNVHNSGNAIDYRIGLINKIGLERVEWIEGPHSAKKYTIEQLKEIKLEYRAKWRELEQMVNDIDP